MSELRREITDRVPTRPIAAVHPLSPTRRRFFDRYSRAWMSYVLAQADLLGLALSLLAAIALRQVFLGELPDLRIYWRLSLPGAGFILFLAMMGLYPAVGLSRIDELRRLVTSISIYFLFMTAFNFWARVGADISRLVLAFTWGFTVVLVPLLRMIVRAVAVRLELWGEPVAVIGGERAAKIAAFLQSHPHYGLRPVRVSKEHIPQQHNNPAELEKTLNDIQRTTRQLRELGIRTVMLAPGDLPAALQNQIIEQQRLQFNRLILMPDMRWVSGISITPYDMDGHLGLEISQNLLNPWQQAFKRGVDFLFGLLGGMVLMPFLLLIAILVRLDSPGPVFYSNLRVGKGGREFKMWKFRTMVDNADEALEGFLARQPELRAEWERKQKLKDDPRITRMGRILRNLSLDELPQIINIFFGDMSLVGPRPIFPGQRELYGDSLPLYQSVRPGLTGMWQVSGRNRLSFSARAHWDEYYIRQWSIWMDIYIIIRTVWVVLRRDGAY